MLMATPALAINIANHKGTLLVSPVWGIVVFSALELAVSLVLGPSVSLVIGFSVSSVFGLFSLGGVWSAQVYASRSLHMLHYLLHNQQPQASSQQRYNPYGQVFH